MVKGYEAVRKERNEGNGGEVITFIKLGVAYRDVKVNEEYESVMIDVRTGNQNIRFINFYNLCKRLNKDLLKNIGGECNLNSVVWWF